MPTAQIEPAVIGKQPWALHDLPPYRPVAKKLMRLAAMEDVPLSRVQETLRTDAVFSGEVLRLANSPLISFRAEITSILHAVAILGLERIKSLATTLVLRSFLTGGAVTPAIRGCWRHNLATAIVCERLARFVHLDRDTCYTAGLLHDIGRLGLLRTGSAEYEQILVREGVTDFELLQFERSVFDIDHCEAGAWILDQWEFPLKVREIALLHHQRPNNGATGLLPVIYAGWQIANFLGFSAASQPVRGDLAEIVEVLPDSARQHVIGDFDGLAEDVAFKINAIECSMV